MKAGGIAVFGDCRSPRVSNGVTNYLECYALANFCILSLRENIEALTKTAEARQFIARYIAKANEQESRLEAIETERKAAQTEKEKLERELATEIKNFEVR